VPRLFVAAWPPPDVVEVLDGFDRRPSDGVRWTTPEQWHVTLRFLGAVDDVDDVVEAVTASVMAQPAVVATMGPATTRLGRTILVAPVAGLERIAASVIAATAHLGAPPENRPFRGHLTLARSKRRLPSAAVGVPIAATWTVSELAVVASDTRPEGARYTDIARVSLRGLGRA
jgi:2'-5' RNA ligase